MFDRIRQNTLILFTACISLKFIDRNGAGEGWPVKGYGIQNTIYGGDRYITPFSNG